MRYTHLPEVVDLWSIETQTSDRIEFKFIKDHHNGRRVWLLCTVWFDGVPVMITQNAGREGDDFARRYVTNAKQFDAMVKHLEKLVSAQNLPVYDVVDPNTAFPELIEFYGERLDSFNNDPSSA